MTPKKRITDRAAIQSHYLELAQNMCDHIKGLLDEGDDLEAMSSAQELYHLIEDLRSSKLASK